MGPLTWNDFHENTAIEDKYSYLEYFMDIKRRIVNVNGINYSLPSVVAYTHADYSWADPSYRTPQMLSFNQCLFDLIEVHRRKIENELCKGSMLESDELMKKGIRRLDEDLTRAEKEMSNGKDSAAIARWQEKVKCALDSIQPYTPTRFDEGGVGLGASIGIGTKVLTGDLAKFFSSGAGMNFNFDFTVGRSYFTWGTYIGAASCRHNIWEKKYFEKQGIALTDLPEAGRYYYNPEKPEDGFEEPLIYKGELATVLDMYWGYGYTVYNNHIHKLTPFGGIGFEGYYVTPDDESYGCTAFSWHLGLDYNWMYRHSVDQGSFSFDPRWNATHDAVSVNCKLYATYNHFRNTVGTPQGFSINLQVSIGLFGGSAHME